MPFAFITLWSGSIEARLFLTILFLIPSLMWIPLMRRFGILCILSVWVSQLLIQGAPLQASGWVARQTLAIHLIPIAIAAWAVWVILAGNREFQDAGRDTGQVCA